MCLSVVTVLKILWCLEVATKDEKITENEVQFRLILCEDVSNVETNVQKFIFALLGYCGFTQGQMILSTSTDAPKSCN